MAKVRITSGGSASDTRVTVGDQDITEHVISIEFPEKIERGSLVTAKIEVAGIELGDYDDEEESPIISSIVDDIKRDGPISRALQRRFNLVPKSR